MRQFMLVSLLLAGLALPAYAQIDCRGTLEKDIIVDDADKILFQKLTSFKYKRYVHKCTISKIMESLNLTYHEYRFVTARMKTLYGVGFFVNGNFHLEFLIYKFRYVQPYSEDADWKLEDVLKETVSVVRVYYKGRCVKEVH